MTREGGNEYWQTGRDRAIRRTRRDTLHQPPDEVSKMNWHRIDTGSTVVDLQWRPGIEMWFARTGERFTAEGCAEKGWRHVECLGPL